MEIKTLGIDIVKSVFRFTELIKDEDLDALLEAEEKRIVE
jgi:hypothetical protein